MKKYGKKKFRDAHRPNKKQLFLCDFSVILFVVHFSKDGFEKSCGHALKRCFQTICLVIV